MIVNPIGAGRRVNPKSSQFIDTVYCKIMAKGFLSSLKEVIRLVFQKMNLLNKLRSFHDDSSDDVIYRTIQSEILFKKSHKNSS